MRDYEFNCSNCDKHCHKRIKPSQEENPPKYCSNKCKFEHRSKLRTVWSERIVQCSWCDSSLTRLLRFDDVGPFYCDKFCAGKHIRVRNGAQEMLDLTTTCEFCDNEFSYKWKQSNPKRRFCSRKCSTKATAQGNRGDEALLRRWTERHGAERAREMLEEHKIKSSLVNSGERNGMFGRTHTDEAKRAISEKCTGIPHPCKGKTFVEFHGPERARELGEQHSAKLKQGFLEGRITPSCNHANSGTYKGLAFRSLLELQFLLQLESEGVELSSGDVVVEPKDMRIPWIDADGIHHVYIPDFFVRSRRTLYEVKPEKFIDNDDVQLKALAAREFCSSLGIDYEFISPLGMRRSNLPQLDQLTLSR